MSQELFIDLAQIYQQRALESLSEEDVAHAKRYRLAAEIEQQRDELLNSLESMVSIARLTIGWSATPLHADGPLVVAERLIAQVKGSA